MPLQPVTLFLILANLAMQGLASLGAGAGWTRAFGLWPLAHGFEPWQLLTHAFLHGNMVHLVFNMVGLWVFGQELERLWGARRLIELYLAGVLGAAAVQLGVMGFTHFAGYAIGASGGVFGLLLAFGLIYPDDLVELVFPPIQIRAKSLVALNAGLALLFGVTGMLSGMAHFAHLGGMAAAYAVIRHWPRPDDEGDGPAIREGPSHGENARGG